MIIYITLEIENLRCNNGNIICCSDRCGNQLRHRNSAYLFRIT